MKCHNSSPRVRVVFLCELFIVGSFHLGLSLLFCSRARKRVGVEEGAGQGWRSCTEKQKRYLGGSISWKGSKRLEGIDSTEKLEEVSGREGLAEERAKPGKGW